MNPITLDLSPVLKLFGEQFSKLAIAHQSLRLERTPDGENLIMSPVGALRE